MTATEPLPDLLPQHLPLLVVDDDESVLQVTRLILSRFRFEGKELEILEASSAADARRMLEQRPDVAVILLDVVMESDDAGLRLVEAIRHNMGNRTTRILLRTGQAGYAPEQQVIQNYDINDYLSKAETTQSRLFFSLTTALRNYRDIMTADYLGRRVAQANQTSLAKTQFLAHMSHEIRTPLNGLLGTVQLLADTDLSSEQKQLIRDIDYTSEALLGIVNDVLDMSKIEAGKLELNNSAFELKQLLHKVTAIFSANMQLKNIHFSVEIQPEVGLWVTGDALRIRQILMNFLSNAYKFTATGGEIRLIVKSDVGTGGIVFEVVDNGVGISPLRMNHVFDAYQQENAAIAERFGGTGLGLSLCRDLAELMGGAVGVQSEEGKGSCFWLMLPLQAVTTQSTSMTADEELESFSVNTKIVICEDDATSRKVLAKMLQKLGATVLAYEHGQAMLDDQQYQDCDLMILDCHMPIKDGFATAVEAKKSGFNQPIVALTAGVLDEECQYCYESGMSMILTKPVNSANLYNQLHRLLINPKHLQAG